MVYIFCHCFNRVEFGCYDALSVLCMCLQASRSCVGAQHDYCAVSLSFVLFFLALFSIVHRTLFYSWSSSSSHAVYLMCECWTHKYQVPIVIVLPTSLDLINIRTEKEEEKKMNGKEKRSEEKNLLNIDRIVWTLDNMLGLVFLFSFHFVIF